MSESIRITLPTSLETWVRSQSDRAGFNTVGEFIRDVLTREQRRALRDEIDTRLIRAVESGPATPMTPADWRRIRREGRKRLAVQKRKPS
jgi:hypothetical protein